MSKMAMIGSFLGISFGLSFVGCTISNCEKGSYCGDGAEEEQKKDKAQEQQCETYCGRLSECGAPQADDFEGCIDACEDRFDAIPEHTAELCACAESSSCADLMEGRCSARDGSGGSGGSGGSQSYGGGSNGGSSYGGSSIGGEPGTGGVPPKGGSTGSGGNHTGGAPTTGGSSGTDGGDCTTGGTGATGGSDAGGAGGEDPGVQCTCDCDCASGQTCVSGYCQ